ncbi:inner membrane protein [Shigella flexneri SFJ17B]|nr:inner membrane protein [Shigella flexneri SFJ17B]
MWERRQLLRYWSPDQLIGGLVLDIFRSHGVPLRALFGPICGAILLVVGAWLVARRSF